MPHIAPWFPKAKLGIFVHWGVFGTMFESDITEKRASRYLGPDEYRRRAELFTCEKWDMAAWAQQFKKWGARYAVLTSRHAQGFALWDTAVDERSIVKMAPYGKDVVRQWCDELRTAGLRVGIYFGHRDWGDEDFCKVMDVPAPEGLGVEDEAEREAAWARYLQRRDAKLIELMENYGQIDQFWADEDWGRTPEQLRAEHMASLIEQRQPRIVMNNRFGHHFIGHYVGPEQHVPLDPRRPGDTPMEVCDTLANWGHWQFVDAEKDYKKKEDVLRFFIDTVTSGANYLINIGPRPDGSIPQEETDILDYLGAWANANAEAIYDTHVGLPRTHYGGGSTTKGNALYLYAVDAPRGELAVRGLKNQVTAVTKLTTGEALPFRRSGGRPTHGKPGYLFIKIPPAEQRADLPQVYQVEFKGKRLEAQ